MLSATLEVPLSYTIKLKETAFSIRLELDARKLKPLVRGELWDRNLKALHLVDPKLHATVGKVELSVLLDGRPTLMSSKGVRWLIRKLKPLLSSDEVVIGSLGLAHGMLELGYKADSDSFSRALEFRWGYGPRPLITFSFAGAYRFTYRNAVTIDARDFISYVDPNNNAVALKEATLYVYTTCCGDAADELSNAALEALKPWSSLVRAKASNIGNGFKLSLEAASTGGKAGFSVSGYLINYIPEVARRVKEYVDSRLGGAQASTT